MNKKEINLVINTSISDYCTTNNIQLISENVIYESDEITENLEVYHMSANSEYIRDKAELLQGLIQINVNVPKGTGLYRIDSILQDLQNIFKANSILENERGKLHIGHTYINDSVSDTDVKYVYYTKILTIEYKEFYYR